MSEWQHQGREMATRYGPFVVLFLLVLLSRMPFTGNGYGLDADAWRIVRAGQDMERTGKYFCSRKPCYPLPEITYWSLTPTTCRIFNGVTALLSALGAVAFAGALRRLRVTDPLLTALAMAFVPVVYINSTNAMDYVWAISFLMISLYGVTAGRFVFAGVFLGMAIASRITSGAMLLPLCILLCFIESGRGRVTGVGKLVLASGIVAAWFFLPVWTRFGIRFWDFADSATIPLYEVVERMTVRAFGALGMISVAGLLLSALVLLAFSGKTRRRWRGLPRCQKGWVLVSFLTIVIYCGAFVRLPHEVGYMIPVAPFVIGLFACLVPPTLTRVAWALLVVAPFVFDANVSNNGACGRHAWSVRPGTDRALCVTAMGPILLNAEVRRQEARRYERAARRIARIAAKHPGPVIVVAGGRSVRLHLGWQDKLGNNVRIKYYLNRQEFVQYRKAGATILVFPDANRFILRKYRINLRRRGAIVIPF